MPAGAQGGLAGTDGDPATAERLGEADPAAFAVAISRLRFEDGAAAHVVLSRDDAFADALAGAPLSADGPLLFTATAALTPATAAEIDRVLPAGGTVYLLGGTAAIAQPVEDQLRGAGYAVARLAGPGRVETSVAVAAEVRRRNPDTALAAVARGFGPEDNPTAAWADSVAAGAWTAREGVPVVITGTESMHPAASAWLTEDDPAQTVLLGGEAALSAAVAAAAPNPRRIAGADRAATAATVATDLLDFPDAGERSAVVFNAFAERGWTRGLAAAGLAAEAEVPLLVVGDSVPPATAALLGAEDDAPQVEVLVAGPVSEVSNTVVAQLEELDAGPPAPQPGVPRLVSTNADGDPADRDSRGPALSHDGSLVAFVSRATNIDGSDANGLDDVFVRDLRDDTIREVSGDRTPVQLGTDVYEFSLDQTRLAYFSQGIGRFDVRVTDPLTGQEVLEAPDIDDAQFAQSDGSISGDGRWLFVVQDEGLFRYEIDTGAATTLVAPDASGQGGSLYGVQSDVDGSTLVLRTDRPDLVGLESFNPQLVALDVASGQTRLLTPGTDGMGADEQVLQEYDMSRDGSRVTFATRASNILPGTVTNITNLYVADVATGATQQVNVTPDGSPDTLGADEGELSDDGTLIAFGSGSENLDPPGEGVFIDDGLFVRDLTTGTTRLVVQDAFRIALSGDGSRAAYQGPLEGEAAQIFVVDLP